MSARPARRTRMRRRGSALVLGAALAAGLGLSADLSAQRPQERRSPDRQELEQRFRAQMARLVQQRLGLDEAGAAALTEVTQRFDSRRRELARSEFQTRRQVEELVEGGSGDAVQARALVERLVELRRQESALFAEEQAALLEVLTPVQVLQLHELREEMGRRIRALRSRGDAAPRRRGGEPPFGNPPGR